MNTSRIDHTNSALILITFVLAWFFPFQLLFFSYAFLGPAHYLTQISWLHDRKYFVQGRGLLATFFVISLYVAILDSTAATFTAICLALAISVYYMIATQTKPIQFYSILGLILLAAGIANLPQAVVFLSILVPTVIHIFFFTGSFLLVGALKNRHYAGYLTLTLFIILGLSFFFMPHQWFAARYDTGGFPVEYFNIVAVYLSGSTAQPTSIESLGNIFAFLSFAYTYHYLNWFSKTGIIQWHNISRQRLIWILALYLLAISVYLYDYNLGFRLLLLLSLLHVLLEFPLNLRTFGTIYSLIGQRNISKR